MHKKFLVTGGTGFIGAAIVGRLIKEGHHVRILDNNLRGCISRLDGVIDKCELITADIRDIVSVEQAVDGVDCVLHLAYVNGTEFFYTNPELVLDIALRGMLNVVDACRKKNVKELILASSSEAYQTPEIIPTPESTALIVPDVLNPRFSYGGGKLACELIAMNYGRKGFKRVVVFRPHNVYGPNMGYEHVLPQLVLRAKEKIKEKPAGLIEFEIQGDGSQTRAFIHIDDFTDCLMKVIESGKHLNIYHIGNPEEITIAEVAKEIFLKIGRDMHLKSGPLTIGSTQRRCPDISKVRSLGFEPKISFRKGLDSLIKWYLNNDREEKRNI